MVLSTARLVSVSGRVGPVARDVAASSLMDENRDQIVIVVNPDVQAAYRLRKGDRPFGRLRNGHRFPGRLAPRALPSVPACSAAVRNAVVTASIAGGRMLRVS